MWNFIKELRRKDHQRRLRVLLVVGDYLVYYYAHRVAA